MKCLWTDKRSGQPSASKLWRTVAYSVATYVVIINARGIAWDLLLVYMAVVGASEIALKLIELKFPLPLKGAPDANP